MARTREEKRAAKAAKEPGRIKQVAQVFTMTRKADPASLWWMLGALLVPIALGVLLAFVVGGGNWLSLVLWILIGIMVGILLFLIVLGRRAERAAYTQIEGRPGAVGAVLKSSLRRGWTGSEMPVAVSPRTQDAIYRAVGRGGVALIGEGPKSRTQKMLLEEKRKVERVVPHVAITFIYVGPDDDAVPLYRIPATLKKLPRTLRKGEVIAVANRLQSLSGTLPVPKGIDPMRARPDRKAMRGR